MILLCPLSGCKRHLTETIGFFRDATGFKKASFGFEKIFSEIKISEYQFFINILIVKSKRKIAHGRAMTVRNDVIARFYKRLKEDNPKRNSKKLIETHFETIQEMLASGSNILFIWEFLHAEGMFPNGYSAFRKALKAILEQKQQEQLLSKKSETTESKSTLKDW